jgi:hypothetical protein
MTPKKRLVEIQAERVPPDREIDKIQAIRQRARNTGKPRAGVGNQAGCPRQRTRSGRNGMTCWVGTLSRLPR